MKHFNCLNLQNFGFCVACLDILLALSTISLTSYYLYNDFVQMANWPQEDVQIINPLGSLIGTLVDYVLVHNFSTAFYMILAVTLWIKAIVNLVVASILIDGIKKQRLICIAPWLINTIVSMLIEIAIFIFMEMKIDEIDASMDRRIARCILFGVFIILNVLATFGIYALYKTLKASNGETRELQESIAETSGLFQHVKV